MNRTIWTVIALILLAGCTTAGPKKISPTIVSTPKQAVQTLVIPTETAFPPTATLAPTWTPVPTATKPPIPAKGYGPTAFPPDIDPLTGLQVSDPQLLNRRPVVVKVENLPREHRPQAGLSLADVVYEYYTEEGTTRFAAVYYGQDAERVGPIRSGRFFDINVVQMYKGIFIFGSAYTDVWNRFVSSDFGNRLILENEFSCPAVCRYDKTGQNILTANTKEVNGYLVKAGINNGRQNLDGTLFLPGMAAGGQPAAQVYTRFSGAIYNRWDYDATSGRYVRFEETKNDINRVDEAYAQLIDKLTGQPVAADNLITLCIPHSYYRKTAETEVVDILPLPASGAVTSCDGKNYPGGSGPAYAARDGQIYTLTWKRQLKTDLITLWNADGTQFALKPGQTWYEVMGASSTIEIKGNMWHFLFKIVP